MNGKARHRYLFLLLAAVLSTTPAFISTLPAADSVDVADVADVAGLAEGPRGFTEEQRNLADAINNVFHRAIEGVRPAVVSLQVSRNEPAGTFLPHGGHGTGLGSGCIIDKRGYIITNDHVVKETDKVDVILADGRRFNADQWWLDPDTDLAIVRIDPAGADLPVAHFGDSDRCRVGDFVLAIGNPFGLDQTVTAGIVSYKGRHTGILDRNWGYEDFIQTDADINKGNSGGPLVNLYGEIIGINSNIFSPTGTSAGYGFAIPSNLARFVADQLIENHRVQRGWLGVGMSALDDLRNIPAELIEKRYGGELIDRLDELDESVQGVLVVEVQPDSPAEQAGMQQYDVIVQVNGLRIDSSKALRTYIATLKPDSVAQCQVVRGSERLVLSVVLGDREVAKAEDQSRHPEQYAQRPNRQFSPMPDWFDRPEPPLDESDSQASPARLGIHVTKLTPPIAREFGYDQDSDGLIITYVQPQSLAQHSGLEVGDIIVKIGDKQIKTTEQLRQLVEEADLDDEGIIIHVRNRNGPARRIVKRGAD